MATPLALVVPVQIWVPLTYSDDQPEIGRLVPVVFSVPLGCCTCSSAEHPNGLVTVAGDAVSCVGRAGPAGIVMSIVPLSVSPEGRSP